MHIRSAYIHYHKLSYISLLLIIQVQLLIGDLHRGHLGSPEVTSRFLPITHDWNEPVTLTWSHCTCHVTTHRLICNMTYSGHVWGLIGQHVTSRDLDLTSNIDLTVQSHHAYGSTHLDKWNTRVPEFPARFFSSNCARKQIVLPKTAILAFLTPSTQAIEVSSNLIACWRKNSSKAIECFFRQPIT